MMHTKKHAFKSIAKKNAVLENILLTAKDSRNFLILGHIKADEDCISSMVTVALVLAKFGKRPMLYLSEPFPEQLQYIQNICLYNKIPILRDSAEMEEAPDAIFVLDTPKPSMILADDKIKGFFEKAVVMEIDHHIGGDAECCGDESLCYVDKSTSTCELLSTICWKINWRKALLQEYGIEEFFTRNVVLCLLTGIIGDTKSGTTLKTNREKFFYKYFADYLTQILRDAYRQNSGNYTDVAEIFATLSQLSGEEREVYDALIPLASFSAQTGAIFLSKEQSAEFLGKYGSDLFVKVLKIVTDALAEQSGRVGATSFYDTPDSAGKIQYRLRAAQGWSTVDFRDVLTRFNITDGGGHPGAVGFRFNTNDIDEANIKVFNESLVRVLNEL